MGLPIEKCGLAALSVCRPVQRIVCIVLIRLTIERRLQHIHEHRVMHRDIKPANIFIASQCIKLGDLGLGRSLNTDSQEAFSKAWAPCSCCC